MTTTPAPVADAAAAPWNATAEQPPRSCRECGCNQKQSRCQREECVLAPALARIAQRRGSLGTALVNALAIDARPPDDAVAADAAAAGDSPRVARVAQQRKRLVRARLLDCILASSADECDLYANLVRAVKRTNSTLADERDEAARDARRCAAMRAREAFLEQRQREVDALQLPLAVLVREQGFRLLFKEEPGAGDDVDVQLLQWLGEHCEVDDIDEEGVEVRADVDDEQFAAEVRRLVEGLSASPLPLTRSLLERRQPPPPQSTADDGAAESAGAELLAKRVRFLQ